MRQVRRSKLQDSLKAGLLTTLALSLWILLYRNLASLASLLTGGIPGLDPHSKLAHAIGFFVYEVPKVLMLLLLVIFAVGILRSWITVERSRRLLSGRRQFAGNILAALLGVATPFCSCSAVPLFIGFVSAGVPLGVTFSFLIAAPMVNEVALVLLFGLLGWKIALLYAAMGLSVAVLAGFLIGNLPLEKHVESWVYEAGSQDAGLAGQELLWPRRLLLAWDSVKEIVGRVWIWVVAGIAVGAGIHGYVPEDLMASLMGSNSWWSVPASVLVGVPMYSNAAGIVPVVQALLEKGAALGTALAFMMAVIALSLPEAIILRKVLRPRLIAIFLGVVAVGILLVGTLFNLLAISA